MNNKKNNKKEGIKISEFPQKPMEIIPGANRTNLNTDIKIHKTSRTFKNISEEIDSQGFTRLVEGWNISDDGVIIKTSTYKGDNVSEALVFVKGHKVEDGKLIKIEHTAK